MWRNAFIVLVVGLILGIFVGQNLSPQIVSAQLSRDRVVTSAVPHGVIQEGRMPNGDTCYLYEGNIFCLR